MNVRNLSIVLLLLSTTAFAQKPRRIFADAAKQSNVMIAEIAKTRINPDLVSPRTLDKGNLKLVASRDWTSGFFPGVLWMLYEYTGDQQWLERAKTFTANIEREKWNSGTHDMGFKIYCSFGSGYRLTNDAQYKDIIVQSARTLTTRFNKTIGCIRSWDSNKDKWDFPVIIDNMMNLELLFAATRLTGCNVLERLAGGAALVNFWGRRL